MPTARSVLTAGNITARANRPSSSLISQWREPGVTARSRRTGSPRASPTGVSEASTPTCSAPIQKTCVR